MFKQKLKSIAFLSSILILSFASALFILAWTSPTAAPPGENVPTPINVGDVPQAKAERIAASEFYDFNNPAYYLNPDGLSVLENLRIGSTANEATNTLGVVAGANDYLWLLGKSLSRDAGEFYIITGDNTNEPLYFGRDDYRTDAFPDYIDMTLRSGNVGIGTTTPGYALDVVGDINITGDFRQDGTIFEAGGIAACSDCDSRFINVSGDTMTGNLTLGGSLYKSGSGTLTIFADSLKIAKKNDTYHSWFPYTNNQVYITGDYFHFRTSDYSDKMTLDGSGNLTVTGNINLKGNTLYFGETNQTINDRGNYITIWNQSTEYFNFHTQGTYAGNFGIGITSPNDKLDVSGWIDTTSGYQINDKILCQWGHSENTGTGWKRIASNPGNRANALFTLRDYISGGGHSTLTFRAGISFNDAGGMSFTVINHNRYGTPTFTKVRILEKTTYDDQYLEVYVARSGNKDFTICDNMQGSGWTPVDWTTGSIPAGYTAREFDVDKLFVVGDYDDRFTIDRGGKVGIGTTKIYEDGGDFIIDISN